MKKKHCELLKIKQNEKKKTTTEIQVNKKEM
jgi:hypothetical protein